MKALGFIETRGLIAAIESADTMLKAADVSIFDRNYVGGGLVSVAVTGDVGAVKAAVEAGVAAVNKIDSSLLVSEHVIPRPHEELDSIIGIKSTTAIIEDSNNNEDDSTIVNNINDDTNSNSDTNITVENIDEACNQDDESSIVIENVENVEEIESISDEDLKAEDNTKSVEIDMENIQKQTVDDLVKDSGIEKAIKVLNSLSLMNLRSLARQYDSLEITNKAISKASKKILISKIKSYYK